MEDFNKALYTLLGKKLKDLREQKDLSQTELSNKIPNIGRTSISNIEQGKQQPPLHVIYLICNELNIDIHAILPTFTTIVNQVNSFKKDPLQEYLNVQKIDSKTKKAIEELLNTKERL